MSPESERAIIAAIRRIVFASLIILGAWFILVGVRVAIPASLIQSMADQQGTSVETVSDLVYESDWSISWWRGDPVTELIGERLGVTVRILAIGGLFSLGIAAILLFFGILISRVTDRPGWLARIRQVLRLVLVSNGVSTPIFILGTPFLIYVIIGGEWSIPGDSPSWIFRIALFSSMLPAWLLVQAGHGELANWPGKLTANSWALVRHLGIKLIIRLMKLTGALIVITVFLEQVLAQPGLGRLVYESAFTRDFPLLFGVAWFFVLVVVLVKLAAELIEIAYNHFGHPSLQANSTEEQAPHQKMLTGWLIFCLVLVFISIMVATIGPNFAPYGYNEISLTDRMVGPSSEYILGTDNLGRDVFSRILYGIRTDLWAPSLMFIPGLFIGWGLQMPNAWAILAGILIMLVFPIGWTILAAYFKKKNNWLGDTLEEIMMLPRDIVCAFPWLVLFLLFMSILEPGFLQLVLAGSLILLPRTLGMMHEAYSSPPEGKGWLYSVLWSIPVMFILAIAGGILYTSSLSYIGFGIAPPMPELGGMLSGTGRQYMLQAPWMAYWPRFVLTLLSFVWVMAGDALLERLGFRSKAVWAKVME